MASKSLREIIRKPVSRKALWSTIERGIHAKTHSDIRSTVITQTALLEVGLERLIRARMRHQFNSDEESGLFGPGGVMSGFSHKIRVAYAFGIIGPITRDDLSSLNDIRNVFAHSPHNVTLKNKKLWARVRNLKIIQFFVDGGYLDDRGGKEVSVEARSAGLVAALTDYAVMLCNDRHKRVMLPPTRGTVFGFKAGNTLRF